MISVLNTYHDDYIPDWHNRKEHVQYHVLALITDGEVSYRFNGRPVQRATQGTLLFIPAGTEREAFNSENAPHQKYACTFSEAMQPSAGLPLLQRSEPLLHRTRAFETMKERMMALHRLTLEARPYFEVMRLGLLLEALGAFNRELDTPALPKRKQQLAEQLEQFMQAHYRKSLSLQQLAQHIGRSPNYTLALFKEATGMSPLVYQHRLRMATAKELLANTDARIHHIAEHLGYYDTAYFHKVFRKHTGMSPGAYTMSVAAAADKPPLP